MSEFKRNSFGFINIDLNDPEGMDDDQLIEHYTRMKAAVEEDLRVQRNNAMQRNAELMRRRAQNNAKRSENITRLAKLRVQVADHIANLTGTIAAEKEMGTAFASLKQQEEEAKQRTTSLYRQHNQLPAKYNEAAMAKMVEEAEKQAAQDQKEMEELMKRAEQVQHLKAEAQTKLEDTKKFYKEKMKEIRNKTIEVENEILDMKMDMMSKGIELEDL